MYYEKKTLKSLKLNKKSISNLDNRLGGRPPVSFFISDCAVCPSDECNTNTMAHTGCIPSHPHSECNCWTN